MCGGGSERVCIIAEIFNKTGAGLPTVDSRWLVGSSRLHSGCITCSWGFIFPDFSCESIYSLDLTFIGQCG